MTAMSNTNPGTGLSRILAAAREFSSLLDKHSKATKHDPADCEDVYNRLSRLKNRFDHEVSRHTLTQSELVALRKVFKEDDFIKGMLDGRQIGEHVQKRSGGGPRIPLYTNQRIRLTDEVSAGAFFGNPIFSFKDASGEIQYHNHKDKLREAERRIKEALRRAGAEQ
jgi:hypothetical protein